MNSQSAGERTGIVYLATVLGAFLIVGALVLAMRHFATPPDLGGNRAAERAKALVELRAADAEALNTVGWVDPVKGLVRLPIQTAMSLVEREWQNPPAARSNLIDRVEKATAPPPKVPEKPSQFE